MKDYFPDAFKWHAIHPEFSVSVFACRFPGHYAEAATAIRVVKALHPSANNEESTMALSTEQLLELKTAEHNATLRDLFKTVELLDYYRSQVNLNGERSRPPSGYWVKEGKTGFVWGLLSDGDIIPNGKGEDYDATVEKCWAHYDKLHGVRHLRKPKPSAEHIDKPKVMKAKDPEPEIDLTDLSDDDEPEEEPPPRRRRRRVVDD